MPRLVEFGFFQIVGHRLPRARIDAMLAASSEFFALPTERQAAVHSVGPVDQPRLRGARHRGPVVQHRARCAARSVRGVQPRRGRGRLQRPVLRSATTMVPSLPTSGRRIHPNLRPALVDYFRSAREVALTLTEIFAIALGLPEGWFTPFVDRSTTTMRAIRYERRSRRRRSAARVSNAWARTPTTGSSPCCMPSRSPVCRSSRPTATGST